MTSIIHPILSSIYEDTIINLTPGIMESKWNALINRFGGNPWLKDYRYRKPVVLTGGSSGAQTDYQLKLLVPYDSNMQNDFSDIRFTTSDGTLINAWLEDKTIGVSADIWVEFPTTPANGYTENYYVYYGNSGAGSVWDCQATMLDGDDFVGSSLNTDIWDQQDCDTSVSDSELTINNFLVADFSGGILGKIIVGPSAITEIRLKNTIANSLAQYGLSNNADVRVDDSNTIYTDYNTNDQGMQLNEGIYMMTSATSWATNTYYKYKIVHNGTNVRYYRDGVEYANSPVTSNVPNDPMYMNISGHSSYSPTLVVDWIFTHKYVANPPSYIFGSEENLY